MSSPLRSYKDASFRITRHTIQKLDFRYRLLTNPLRALPNFMLCGVVKGGTTSLFSILSQHPQLHMSVVKEPNYFNLNYHQGLHWYRAHFPMKRSAQPVGEGSVTYFTAPEVPPRIKATLGTDLRFIVLMRHPIKRAFSQYQMEQRRHPARKLSFAERVEAELDWLKEHPMTVEDYQEVVPEYGSLKYVRRGLYLTFIQYWLRYFDRDQFLFLRSEDFFQNPDQVVTQVSEYLGVEPPAQGINRQKNLGGYSDKIPNHTRARLQEFYHPYNQALYEFLGCDLGWQGG